MEQRDRLKQVDMLNKDEPLTQYKTGGLVYLVSL